MCKNLEMMKKVVSEIEKGDSRLVEDLKEELQAAKMFIDKTFQRRIDQQMFRLLQKNIISKNAERYLDFLERLELDQNANDIVN